MFKLQQITNNLLSILLTNNTVKEITEAIAIIEIEETLSKMFYEEGV